MAKYSIYCSKKIVEIVLTEVFVNKIFDFKGFCKLQCLHFWLYFILFWCPNALICVVFIVFYLLWNFILYNKKLRVINHNLIRIVLHFFYCTIIVSKLLNLIVRFLIYHIEKKHKIYTLFDKYCLSGKNR